MSKMSESHNIRLDGMKQDILEVKNEFTSSTESLKSGTDEKLNFANKQFDNIRTDINKKCGSYSCWLLYSYCLLEAKDSIIEALKAENLKLKQKVEKLENRISALESDLNKKDQYNLRKNIENQGIPSDIEDDSCEDKVSEMFVKVHMVSAKSDIEDCYRLGKNGNTIVQLVNRKFCNDILGKKMTYTKTLTSLNLVLVIKVRFVLVKIQLVTTNALLGNAGS